MFPPESILRNGNGGTVFFKNGGLLTYSSVSQILNFISERTSDPSPTRYGLQHPRKDCRGQVGDS